jgi:hypothetical protein
MEGAGTTIERDAFITWNRKGFLEIQLNERISKPQETLPSYFEIAK